MSHHLAQVNIARTIAPFGNASMAGLVSRIAAINALAEGSPGFVWRYQAPEDGSKWFAPFEDYLVPFERDRFFFNMSVWESVYGCLSGRIDACGDAYPGRCPWA